MTAWQFINFAAELGEDSNLTRTAALLEELGLAAGLDQLFSGTLLLPNNAVRTVLTDDVVVTTAAFEKQGC
jgi:hypothetical protein